MGLGTSPADAERELPGPGGRMALMPSANGQSAVTYKANTLRMITGNAGPV